MTRNLLLLLSIFVLPLSAQECECPLPLKPPVETAEHCEGVCTAICYEPYCYIKPCFTATTVAEGVPAFRQKRHCRMERHQCAHIYNRYSHEYDYEVQPRMRIRHKRVRQCTYVPRTRYRKVYARLPVESCNTTVIPGAPAPVISYEPLPEIPSVAIPPL